MVFSIATAALNLLSMGAAGWLIFSRAAEFGPPPPLAPTSERMTMVPSFTSTRPVAWATCSSMSRTRLSASTRVTLDRSTAFPRATTTFSEDRYSK